MSNQVQELSDQLGDMGDMVDGWRARMMEHKLSPSVQSQRPKSAARPTLSQLVSVLPGHKGCVADVHTVRCHTPAGCT
jgi:hypothetical protein